MIYAAYIANAEPYKVGVLYVERDTVALMLQDEDACVVFRHWFATVTDAYQYMEERLCVPKVAWINIHEIVRWQSNPKEQTLLTEVISGALLEFSSLKRFRFQRNRTTWHLMRGSKVKFRKAMTEQVPLPYLKQVITPLVEAIVQEGKPNRAVSRCTLFLGITRDESKAFVRQIAQAQEAH